MRWGWIERLIVEIVERFTRWNSIICYMWCTLNGREEMREFGLLCRSNFFFAGMRFHTSTFSLSFLSCGSGVCLCMVDGKVEVYWMITPLTLISFNGLWPVLWSLWSPKKEKQLFFHLMKFYSAVDMLVALITTISFLCYPFHWRQVYFDSTFLASTQ